MTSRRNFIKKSTLAAFATLLGTEVAFGAHIPDGWIPILIAEEDFYKNFNKHQEMVVING